MKHRIQNRIIRTSSRSANKAAKPAFWSGGGSAGSTGPTGSGGASGSGPTGLYGPQGARGIQGTTGTAVFGVGSGAYTNSGFTGPGAAYQKTEPLLILKHEFYNISIMQANTLEITTVFGNNKVLEATYNHSDKTITYKAYYGRQWGAPVDDSTVPPSITVECARIFRARTFG